MRAEELQSRFLNAKLTLSTAESCTGGNIAHVITVEPGSSGFYIGGVVTYHNSVKESLIGVEPLDITKYGVVSETVAVQMAAGIRRKLNSNYSISTTGIAGPSGGTKDVPIGTVWIGVSSEKRTIAKKFNFVGTRESIINQATNKAIEFLLSQL